MEKQFTKTIVTVFSIILYISLSSILIYLDTLGIVLILILSVLIIPADFYFLGLIDKAYSDEKSEDQIHPPSSDSHTLSETPLAKHDSMAPAQSSKDHAAKPYMINAFSEFVRPSNLISCLWGHVDVFQSVLHTQLSLFDETILFTAYFYVCVKIIRNQSIVDDIYASFYTHTREYFGDRMRGIDPFLIIQGSYKKFAEVLNCSGIDPRTEDGIFQLWSLIQEHASFDENISESARKKFLSDSVRLEEKIRQLHPITNNSRKFSLPS